MFQDILKKITKNFNPTKEQISKTVNLKNISEKYHKLLNNPYLKNITNINSEEYKQKINFLQQRINDLPFVNKFNNNNKKTSIFIRFFSKKSSGNDKIGFFKGRATKTFYNKFTEKVMMNVRNFKNKLKYKAYKMIFYLFAIYVLVKSIKYFLGRLFSSS